MRLSIVMGALAVTVIVVVFFVTFFLVGRPSRHAVETSLEEGGLEAASPSQGRHEEEKPAHDVESAMTAGQITLTPKFAALRNQANDAASRLIRVFPNSADAMAVMALVHDTFGENEEAMKCLERCVQLDPNCADAYEGMGASALKTGDFEKAAGHLRKVLEIDPTKLAVRESLAFALLAQNKPREAIAVLADEIVSRQRRWGIFFRLGRAYSMMDEYEKARENCLMAIEIDPNRTEPYHLLARICARLGQKEESKMYLMRYKELSQRTKKANVESVRRYDDLAMTREDVADILTAAGEVYLRNMDLQDGEKQFLQAAQLDPRNTACRNHLVSLYQQSGRVNNMIEQLKALQEIEPANATHPMRLGAINVRLNRFDAAERAFQRAKELAPRRPEGYVALARFYLQSNQKTAEALELARVAVQLEPNAPNYVLLSMASNKNGDHAGAMAAIEQATVLDPDNHQLETIRNMLKREP